MVEDHKSENTKLESVRQQIWQEIEHAWEVRNPGFKKRDPYESFGDEEPTPAERESMAAAQAINESDLKARKITDYFGASNFPLHLPGEHRDAMLEKHADFSSTDPSTATFLYPTYRKFTEDIDLAIQQAGLTKEEYRKLKEARDKDRFNVAYELKCQEAILEIFIRYRMEHPFVKGKTITKSEE